MDRPWAVACGTAGAAPPSRQKAASPAASSAAAARLALAGGSLADSAVKQW